MCVMKIYSVSGPSEARSPVAGLLFYLGFFSHVSLHLSKLLHDLLLHLFLLRISLLAPHILHLHHLSLLCGTLLVRQTGPPLHLLQAHGLLVLTGHVLHLLHPLHVLFVLLFFAHGFFLLHLVEELLLVFVSPSFPAGLQFGSLGFPGSLAAIATFLEPTVHEAHAVLGEPGFHVFLGGSSPAGSGAAFLSPPVASLFLLAPGLRLSNLVARVGLPNCFALAVAPAGAPGNDNSGLPLVLAFTLLMFHL